VLAVVYTARAVTHITLFSEDPMLRKRTTPYLLAALAMATVVATACSDAGVSNYCTGVHIIQ